MLLADKKAFLCDMDGVIYHGNRLLPAFPNSWIGCAMNRTVPVPHQQQRALPARIVPEARPPRIEVPEENFYTSALATAAFVASQMPGGSAYVIGEPGLHKALYDAGFP